MVFANYSVATFGPNEQETYIAELSNITSALQVIRNDRLKLSSNFHNPGLQPKFDL